MVGVDINYRRLGILTELMNYQINWTKNKGYHILKIKTRNNRREMLSFLIKNGFYFTEVEEKEDIHLIPRKDMKSIFNCSDVTVAQMFNREDFPAIMIGEHKVEKSALKKWLQERRV